MIRTDFSRYEFPELIDQRGYKSAVEVGVNIGQFSYYLLKHSKLEILVGVDPFAGRFKSAMKGATSLLEPYTVPNSPRYRLIRKHSMQAAADLAKDGRWYDFIYIDADHHQDCVRDDITCWMNLVRPGGILAGHDYVEDHPGVMAAVDEFAAKSGWPLYVTREAWGSWFFEIPK